MGSLTGFDFDDWARLARSDPEAFERRRAQVIERLIRSSSPRVQQRLRGLQFQVDAQRRLSGNPLGACIRISRMMLRMFYDEFVPVLNGRLPSCRTGKPGHVIPFRRRD
ncbi:MAG: DUF3135 domain-containing protein [Pseudomonadota bacterium]|jgi:hypothetical protein